MKGTDNIHITFNLNVKDYENKEAFAKDCSEVLLQIKGSNIGVDSVFFEWQNEKKSYTLATSDKFSMNQLPEKLALMVSEEKFDYQNQNYDNPEYDKSENETEEDIELPGAPEIPEEAVEAEIAEIAEVAE